MSTVFTLRMITFRMITQNRWRLPVVSREDPQKLLGIVTQRDLLRARERLLNEERRRERVLHLRWVTASHAHTHNHSRPHAHHHASSETANPLPNAAQTSVPSEVQS